VEDELRTSESNFYCSCAGIAVCLPLASALGHPLLVPRGFVVDDSGVR
jgi:hypothetical protein